MERNANARVAIIWGIGLLLLISLACAQAGEILTPAEATTRAQEAAQPARPTSTPGAEDEDAEFKVGDTVWLTAKRFLANLMDGPCSNHMIAVQERGTEVTILDVAECEDQTWYLIDAPTGEGWVPAENISTEAP
jgi:hypothetical protein